jgi:hypothetical protein
MSDGRIELRFSGPPWRIAEVRHLGLPWRIEFGKWTDSENGPLASLISLKTDDGARLSVEYRKRKTRPDLNGGLLLK